MEGIMNKTMADVIAGKYNMDNFEEYKKNAIDEFYSNSSATKKQVESAFNVVWEQNDNDFTEATAKLSSIMGDYIIKNEHLALTKNNVKVEWTYHGEGHSGDYNSNDPDDTELLRFFVYKRMSLLNEWEYVKDSSYCTCFPLNSDNILKVKALLIIMDLVYDKVVNGQTIKKVCERISHIDETCEIPTL